MQRRALALILSLAMLVCLVSATGLLSVSADDTQWTGSAELKTIPRGIELTAYMAEQGITESALNYHMNPTVYNKNGGSNINPHNGNGLARQLSDGDLGDSNNSGRVVYYPGTGNKLYFTYDLLQGWKCGSKQQENTQITLTDFVVVGSQSDEVSFLIKNVEIYVSDTAYDGKAAEKLGQRVFSYANTSTEKNDYNYYVHLSEPIVGQYVTFIVGDGCQYGQLRLCELAAYGTRVSSDENGNAVQELRAAQDLPTYVTDENALKSATGKQINGSAITLASNLVNGAVSTLTTNVDYLVTDQKTTTYKAGDTLYDKYKSNFADGSKKYPDLVTANDDGSYTVKNIPLSDSEIKGTDGKGTGEYAKYVQAYIGWQSSRYPVQSDYADPDRNILGSCTQFYYDLGGVTDVEKVMVASGVQRNAGAYNNAASTISNATLNSLNGELENSGLYIVSGIKLYVADTLEELIADGAFKNEALVAEFTQNQSHNMDTTVGISLAKAKGRYVGFTLTTPKTEVDLRLSELAVKTGEKHGNWHIDTASAADTAGNSLLNTVGVASTNLANSATEVAKLGDGYGTSNNKVDINTSTSNDGKNADGDTMACIPGEGTEIKGTSGWAKVWLELNAEVSIDSFLMMGSLGDSDSGGNYDRKSLCRNRTIAYYRIYVSDSKDDLFTDGKMVVDCNNVGDNVLGSNPASGAYDAFRNYLEAPVTGRFIGVKLTTGAYGSARVGEFHVYGKAIADVTTWTDCSSSDITVPSDNLLAGVYKNVTAYEQHSLKAGQEDELTKWSTGNAANFDKVFDGKVWAGSSSEDNNNSKWTPIVEDTNTDSTKSANYIWLDFDLGLHYNIDTFFHAAADRGASTVDFFVTDKSVAELVESKAEPNVYMIGETSGPKGVATYKKLHDSVQGSHVIVRLKSNLNAGMYQMWVSELAVSGEMASPLYYKGASKRLEDNGLRFGFNVAVKDAAYLNGDPQESNDYRRDISKATIVVNGESRKVKAFGAIVTNLKEGWASYLTDVTAAEKDTKHVQVVEANNLYAVQTGYVTYTALVKGIPEAYKDRVIHARSYVAYEDANGNLQYIYGEIVSSSVAAIG